MTTIITKREAKKNSRKIATKVRASMWRSHLNKDGEPATCFDCNNYNAGSCSFRLNSPDYITYDVSAGELACDHFNEVIGKAEKTPQYRTINTYSDTADFMGLSSVAGGHDDDKATDHRKVLGMQTVTVDFLHRLGFRDEQYPALLITVMHKGERSMFFLPNTKEVNVKVPLKNLDQDQRDARLKRGLPADHVKRAIPEQRYSLPGMYARIADKGVVRLQHWKKLEMKVS